MPKEKLSDTELEIMEVLWESEEGRTPSDLLSHFAQQNLHQWKRQTISTFLSRLTEKGFITGEKQGRSLIYRPKLTRAQYESRRSRSILENLYHGSVKNFLASLSEDKPSPQELQDLKQWIAELEEE